VLRLPAFDVAQPATVAEALALLREPGTRVLAGGTDLLPNLKHRLDHPTRLVSLARFAELRRVAVDGDVLRLGAAVTLTELASHVDVQAHAPSLAKAAGLVASPLIRNRATLGGNVNLDTRCRYVNQTEFWRGAIGGCLKSEGDVCHVVPSGKRCVAAMSSDCVPVLVSLGARMHVSRLDGDSVVARVVNAGDYFRGDGVRHTVLERGELLTTITVPIAARRRAAYVKWSVRGSIDFPLVSIALRFDLDERDRIATAAVVVGALGAKPKSLGGLAALTGTPVADPIVASTVAAEVAHQCTPLANIPYDPSYRRRILPVLAARGTRTIRYASPSPTEPEEPKDDR
jgi:4-hydroxybenzoyl-CoA reductase subunit beta